MFVSSYVMKAHPIDKWCKAKRKTRAELAQIAGVSHMAVWRIIAGKNASLAMMAKISDVTQIPVSTMIRYRERGE